MIKRSGKNMFSIGDKIVYPMHGAGIIESIEEKEILGEKKKYYVMKMPVGDMKVMIPINNVDCIGIRDIINKNDADKVFKSLEITCDEQTSNWNKRYRENMTKIKSGNVFEVAEVVKSLVLRERQKGLSTGERKMLNSAKQILISELVLAKNMNPMDVEELINERITT
jgi:CarD family transcriptional regulator